jgi:hypothetical protein
MSDSLANLAIADDAGLVTVVVSNVLLPAILGSSVVPAGISRMNIYYPGNTINLEGTFQTEAGVYFNPGAVVCSVMSPMGETITNPSVTNSQTGYFTASVVANDPGVWQYRFAGTSPTCSSEGQFTVRESAFVS